MPDKSEYPPDLLNGFQHGKTYRSASCLFHNPSTLRDCFLRPADDRGRSRGTTQEKRTLRGCLITLTPAGHKIAARIYGRHKLLTEFFVRLGVSQETAAADACKVEHDLSEETFEKLLLHAQKNSEDPGTR